MQLLANGRQQFIDSNGLPLANGQVYFYQPGTTTPATTYQDSAGLIPNTNPVVLDSNGQAVIWGNGTYRQVVLNASSVQVWDQIAATPDLNAPLTTLASSSGASLIGYGTTNLGALLGSHLGYVGTSIAALRALDKTKYGQAVITGYYAAGDGGGGVYYYDSADTTSADNGGTIIVAADGGRWKLVKQATVSVKQFGAKGDNTADDTAAFQAAITAASSAKFQIDVPASSYKITAPLVINTTGLLITGDGELGSVLNAFGNFTTVLQFNGSAQYCTVRGISIHTGTTTTQCVNLAVNALVIKFEDCEFTGALTGDLCYSNGQNLDFDGCTFTMNAAGTYAVNFDCYNQNCGITNCRFGGIGKGVRVTNAFAPATRTEGLRIVDSYFINTGTTNVELGSSLFTTITGSILDQSSTIAVDVQAGTDNVIIDGCYVGSSVPATAVGIQFEATAGKGHVISNNTIGYNGYGITALATVSNRVTGLSIIGNTFNTCQNPLLLDSVLACQVTGNEDQFASPNGSWQTKGTFGAGSYVFDNNRWFTNNPALFHAPSVYRFGNDIGMTGRNRGGAVVGTSATTTTISHGCFTTPNIVVVTPEAASNPGVFNILNRTATTFQISWATAGTPTWHWQAEV